MEWTGVTADQIDTVRRTCPTTVSPGDAGVTTTATFSTGHCSTEGLLGGCRTLPGAESYTFTAWYYQDARDSLTPEDVSERCASSGATFVPAS